MGEDWYYFQNGSQVGPVTESAVREMLQSGRLRWDDLVWHDGLPDWLSAERIPNLASSRVLPIPAPAPAPPPFVPSQPLSAIRPLSPSAPAAPMLADVSQATAAILGKTRPWVRLLGILAFVGCILMVLFGVGALVVALTTGGGGITGVGIGAAALLAYLIAAVLIFPIGLFLNRFAKAIRTLQASGRNEDLERALLAQKSYWKYIGILTLVGMTLSILGSVAMLIFGLSSYLGSSY